MLVSVPVLEETLCIESVFDEQVSESLNDFVRLRNLELRRSLSSVHRLSSDIVKCDVNILLKSLLGEDLVDSIAEFSPFNMLSFFRRSEMVAEEAEFGT